MDGEQCCHVIDQCGAIDTIADDERHDPLAEISIAHTDDGSLGDARVGQQGSLDFMR